MRTFALILFLALFPLSGLRADEFGTSLKGALAGSYQDQRNVAYSLEHGDGVAKNKIESCAWRIIIIATQGAAVGDTDLMIDERCGNKDLLESAELRSQTLIKKIKPKPRSLNGDIFVLTNGNCPGPACTGESKTFSDDYRQAIAGNDSAMRKISLCFAKGCDGNALGYDGFKACLWAQQIISYGSPTKADLALSAQNCVGPDTIAGKAQLAHSKFIKDLRANLTK
jgi:hypothetical protein